MAHSDELHTRPEDQSVANNEAREVALGNEHLRRALEQYTTHTAHALNIDSYAEWVQQVNRASGL